MSDVLKCIGIICTRLIDATDYLNDLDSVMGDGEHGSNIKRCFSLVQNKVQIWESKDDKSIIEDIGMTLLAAGGGTATTLMGFFCMKCANKLKKIDDISVLILAAVLEDTLESISTKSKAVEGDKTLMDALIPAIRSFSETAHNNQSLKECFVQAAAAASQGVASTKDMIAKRGRGLYVGERGLGVADPGATSVSIIFQVISETL